MIFKKEIIKGGEKYSKNGKDETRFVVLKNRNT